MAMLHGQQQVFASLESPSILPTPPMGFNDWARFECNINETLFTETADAMKARGLLAAGYNRINIDDCWPLHERRENGSLQWDPALFPRGMFWLGDYLHQQGFHFGIYSDAGNETCGGYPGSLGYEEEDAETFASWGIDYLKLDGCNVYANPGQTLESKYRQIYHKWHQIFAKSDKPLIFSESAPAYFAGEENLTDWFTIMDWVPRYGELARHSQDIATHKSTKDPWSSVMANYDEELRVGREQGPGYYNDPDFLIADEPYLTMTEKRSHFALWASLSAPLIISAYIPDLPDATVQYLTNKNFIAVNQDALALQATLVSRDDNWDVLAKPLSNGDRLVTILNKSGSKGTIQIPIPRTGYTGDAKSLSITNLWTGKQSSIETHARDAAIKADVPSHGTAAYRIGAIEDSAIRKASRSPIWQPTGAIVNAASFNCMTSNGFALSWSRCNGSDGQVWHVGSKGANIRPLLNSTQCLTSSGTRVFIGACRGVQWLYNHTGNVRKSGSKLCLAEGNKGEVLLQQCGFLQNNQVFELPSGWQL